MRHAASGALALLVVTAAPARADEPNWLVGPVLGLRMGGPPEGSRFLYGVEGGVGYGPERANVGFTRRLERTFVYAEIDPWLYVGGTLGVGAEAETGAIFPVIGIWEGVPIEYPDCAGDGLHPAVTLAVGYRWTGVHELYATMKAGRAPSFCLD